MRKFSLFYASLCTENKGIKLVHISWIIISLRKVQLNRHHVASLCGIIQIC